MPIDTATAGKGSVPSEGRAWRRPGSGAARFEGLARIIIKVPLHVCESEARDLEVEEFTDPVR